MTEQTEITECGICDQPIVGGGAVYYNKQDYHEACWNAKHAETDHGEYFTARGGLYR